MSSALRLSVIMVLLLAATAFGLIAYNLNVKKPLMPPKIAEKGPAARTVGYFVAARPLSKGTLVRKEDFTVRSVPPAGVPKGAILETADSKAGLPGSLVRKFVDVGNPVTLQDILRPRDRGFLASVLAPNTRAISIKVDDESGVSGLIRPGDYVDVILTEVLEKADPARRALSETVLRNVRVIAIDQQIEQGGQSIGTKVGKLPQTVSFELTPEQVKNITVAEHLGTLSLAVRAAIEQWDTAHASASNCGASSQIPLRTAAVMIYSGGQATQYSVRKQDSGDSLVSCDGSEVARQTAEAAGYDSKLPEKRR